MSSPAYEKEQCEDGGSGDRDVERDRPRQAERREIDARDAKHTRKEDRRAEADRHREQSAEDLTLAGLLVAVAPRDERVETGEERCADGCREHDPRRDGMR